MKILLIVVAIIAVAVFVFFMGGQPPLRGAGQLAASDQTVIVSRARPPLTFAPAADMRLQGLGNRTLRPKTRHSGDGRGGHGRDLGVGGRASSGVPGHPGAAVCL